MKKIIWAIRGIGALQALNDELISVLVLTVVVCVFLGWLFRGAPEGW